MSEYWPVQVVADQPGAGRLADRPLGQLLADLAAVGWAGYVNIRQERTLSLAVVAGQVGVVGRGASPADIAQAFDWRDAHYALKSARPVTEKLEEMVPIRDMVIQGILRDSSDEWVRDRMLRVANQFPIVTEGLDDPKNPSRRLMKLLAARCTGTNAVQTVCGRNCAFGRTLCLAIDLRLIVLSPIPRRERARVAFSLRSMAVSSEGAVTLELPAFGRIQTEAPRLAVANHPESTSFLPATSETLPRFAAAKPGEATPLPLRSNQRSAMRYFRLGRELAQRGSLRRAFEAFDKAAELDPGNESYLTHRDELRHLIE